MSKTLLEIHEDVPANHYDLGIKNNLFQRYWHLKRFKEVLAKVKIVDGPILDIGCHGGTFTEKIISKTGNKKIYGVDISPSAIKLVQTRIPNGHFMVADAHKLPFKNSFFEEVVCLEVLEHVDNPSQVVAEIWRVLKKRGWVIILIPTDNFLFKFIWFLWTLYYPIWRHAHVQSFTNNSLEKLIKSVGLEIKDSKTFNLRMLKILVCQKK